MTDNEGNVRADVAQILTGISGVNPATDLAPIIAFELNLVGPANKESSVLSSGAGTIVYEASSPLTVLSEEPPCAEFGYTTAENANSSYGLLPASSSNTFTQSFSIAQTMVTCEESKRRPSLTIPPVRTIPPVKIPPVSEGYARHCRVCWRIGEACL